MKKTSSFDLLLKALHTELQKLQKDTDNLIIWQMLIDYTVLDVMITIVLVQMRGNMDVILYGGHRGIRHLAAGVTC